MASDRHVLAQRLMIALFQCRRIKWKKYPIEDLTPGEVFTLFSIKRSVKPGEAGVMVSEISRLLHIAPPTMTQTTNSLEAMGLIERSVDKADRRVVLLNLTDRGERAVQKALDGFMDLFEGLIDHLGEDGSRRLIDLLSEVTTYFNKANH